MLDMLDVVIGFATLMLAVSLIIMSLTQAIASALALRGRKLRTGLEALITYAAPSLKGRARELSTKILRHPLVSDSAVTRSGAWGWATAIKREELVPVLEAVLPAGTIVTDEDKDALEQWFDSFMTRVSQWFVMNTRWITVGLAFVLAFSLGIDSFQVFERLQEDSVVRAKLTAMSSSLLDQAPEVTTQVETSYAEALKEVVAANAAQFTEGANPDVAIGSRAEAIQWIHQNAKPDADAAGLDKQFGAAVDARLSTALTKSIDRARSLEASLTSTGLVGMGHAWGEWLHPSSRFLGVLTSVFFLSLGAPFWFNVLKNTVSFRSAVAQKDSEEEKGTQQRGLGRAALPKERLVSLPALEAAGTGSPQTT